MPENIKIEKNSSQNRFGSYLSFEPKDKPTAEVHKYLLGGVTPRPIAFVSTISDDGIDNLAPYSFFNAFGANPPYIAFSPARRGRDNTTKDTYHNLLANKECVVHIVSHSIVHQMNLASCEYGPEVDEFEKAGFTKLESDIVRPKRVKESPFHMECVLDQMIELGGKAGSGNLAICRVVKFHVAEDIIENDAISPQLLDAMGRNGGNYYTRSNYDALIQIDKPNRDNGVGFDALPMEIKTSKYLTGNDLARLAMVSKIPNSEKAKESLNNYLSEGHELVEHFQDYLATNKDTLSDEQMFFNLLKNAIDSNEIDLAWNLIVVQDY